MTLSVIARDYLENLGHANLDMTIKVYARFIRDEHLKINRNLSVF